MPSDKTTVKFRGIYKDCKEMVEKYKRRSKDNRRYPEFWIGTLNDDLSQGKIHFIRKDIISKEKVYYNSIAELALIFERIGEEWKATSPYRK